MDLRMASTLGWARLGFSEAEALWVASEEVADLAALESPALSGLEIVATHPSSPLETSTFWHPSRQDKANRIHD